MFLIKSMIKKLIATKCLGIFAHSDKQINLNKLCSYNGLLEGAHIMHAHDPWPEGSKSLRTKATARIPSISLRYRYRDTDAGMGTGTETGARVKVNKIKVSISSFEARCDARELCHNLNEAKCTEGTEINQTNCLSDNRHNNNNRNNN